MRVPRIYTPQQLAENTLVELQHHAVQHLRVLRMQQGTAIELFDGRGHAHMATLEAISKKNATARIDQPLPSTPPSPLDCEIAVAVSKGDKMDLIVQKATELGVTSISPVTTVRTDVKLGPERWQKKHQHWQQVMISACEQCGRNDLVEIRQTVNLSDWLADCQAQSRVILHPHQADAFSAGHCSASLAMCFGPEGGFSDEEITQATRHGFQAVVLGPRILRAETAPLAALAMAQSWFGDFVAV